MSFSTYADLKTQLDNWLKNDELTDRFDDCITLFEAWVARRLRVRGQETTTQLTTVSGSVALPSDYLQWRQLVWTNQPDNDLKYRTPSGLTVLHSVTQQGIPSNFTIRAGNILIRDFDDTANAFTFDYLAKPSALITSLNFIYTNHPDAYLYGTLEHAYWVDRNYDESAACEAKKEKIFDQIERLDMRTRAFGPIVIAGPTP